MSKLWYNNLNEKGKEYFNKTLAASEHMTWEEDMPPIEDVMSPEEFKVFCRLMEEVWEDIKIVIMNGM